MKCDMLTTDSNGKKQNQTKPLAVGYTHTERKTRQMKQLLTLGESRRKLYRCLWYCSRNFYRIEIFQIKMLEKLLK